MGFSGCGLAGILELIPGASKAIDRKVLSEALFHRGPNGHGQWSSNSISLIHRRLSILDLSSKGRQPMTRDQYTIVLNGEIYNFQEIRSKLIKSGFTFSSNTDTEVLLRAYQQWGIAALDRVNGMFAFAIWDEQEQELVIARDRMGEKPFYYYQSHGYFTFASEIQALLRSGAVKPEINHNKLTAEIAYSSFFMTDWESTLIDGVKSLLPGHYGIIKNNHLSLHRYWDLPVQKRHNISKSDSIDQFNELLTDSIRLRLISDVPVTTFLSGGLDSSIIVKLVAKQLSGMEQTSITINYLQGGIDPYTLKDDQDLEYSKILASHVGESLDHRIIEVNSSQLTLDAIDEIMDFASLTDDDRLLSVIQNYKLVKDIGYKVVLNGQGADEIMAGYVGLPIVFNTLCDIKDKKPVDMTNFYRNYSRLTSSIFSNQVIHFRNEDTLSPNQVLGTFIGEPLEASFRFLTQTALQRILRFEDLLSMTQSIECRLPYLDYRIVEWAFSIPYRYHVSNNEYMGKMLMREMAKGLLPHKLVVRPKQTFPATDRDVGKRILIEILYQNKEAITASSISQQYFNPTHIYSQINSLEYDELWKFISVWRLEEHLKKIT